MRHPALSILILEDRANPVVLSQTTGMAVGEDTFTNRNAIYTDTTGIRTRTGDPTLAGPSASMFKSDGTFEQSFALGSEFSGGVRVARADFNNDGKDDLLVGNGPGVPARVRVYDGNTRALLIALRPFEESFTGGVFVSAGDLNGDLRADLVITPDEGGGPRVRAFSGATFAPFLDFLGIEDPNFRGGARTAVGDITGDSFPDLIVAAGFGGGPRIAGWDASLRTGTALTRHAFPDFYAFEQTLRNGVYVAAGDVNADGIAEVMVGAGPGGAPRVRIFNGRELQVNRQSTLSDFFVGDLANRGGIRVAAKDIDGDFQADLVTGDAPPAGVTVITYAGKNLGLGNTVSIKSFEAFGTGSFADGVFVG